MRIIAGTARGTKLFSPSDDRIRPTGDRVKESLFNILMNQLPDASVLDLFCGAGSLGLEALSRGASKVIFVDSSRQSLDLTKRNIEKTHFGDSSKLILAELPKGLTKVPQERYDLIFADPPYQKLAFEILIELSFSNYLAPKGLLILEHDKNEKLPDEAGVLYKFREKQFGKTKISFYCLQTANEMAEGGTACELQSVQEVLIR